MEKSNQTDPKFKEFVNCIMRMSTDYLMNGINKETYLTNLDIIVTKMKGLKDR